MDNISRGFDFVIGLNFTFGMYSISQLKVLGRFKKLNLKNYVFTAKSIFVILINYQ